MQLKYSEDKVVEILREYEDIWAGNYNRDFDDDTSTGAINIYRANFETPIIHKSDIDCGIDRLSDAVPGRWLKWCRDLGVSPDGQGLSMKQYKLAKFIIGYDREEGYREDEIRPIAREIAGILSGKHNLELAIDKVLSLVY